VASLISPHSRPWERNGRGLRGAHAGGGLGELLSWRVGLARLPLRAKTFYPTIAVAMGLGVALNFSTIDPIRALYWSAVLNEVVAVPVMVTMMLLTRRRSITAGFTLPLSLLIVGWVGTATMAVTTVAMVASWFD
jgi:Mn2+/Fe2+ NRAMP family transporter